MRSGFVVAVALVLAVNANGAAMFTPRTLAGTWSGGWTNQALGTAGPVTVVVRSLAGGSKLVFSASIRGAVFGCSSVPPETTRPLTKGVGVNHWGPAGFVIKGRSKSFGVLVLRYRSAIGALTGSGANPPCAHGVTWT